MSNVSRRLGVNLVLLVVLALCLPDAFLFSQEKELAAGPPPLPEPAWEELRPGDRREIERAYERAQREPENAEAVGMLGMALHAHRKFEAAEICYQRARALEPDLFRWTYYLGIVEESLRKPGEALETIRKAIELNRGYAPAHVRLAQLLKLTGGEPEAVEQIYREAIAQNPDLPSAHYGLGRLLAAKGEWKTAAESYERARTLNPNYGAAHYGLGLAYRNLGEKENAEKALRRYEQLRPVPTPLFDPLMEAVVLLHAEGRRRNQASLSDRKSNLQGFIQELERAVERDPGLVSARSTLITLYQESGRPEKSEEHYRAAVEIDPSYPEAHHNWGLVRLLQGNLSEATEAFQKALEIDPEHADAHAHLGLVLEQQGQADEARRHYQIALKSDPLHRQGHYLMGRSLVRMGRVAEAIPHLQETIRIEDARTPSYMRALAAAYEQSADLEQSVYFLRQARERAVSFGLSGLVSQLDKALQRLGAAPEAP